MHMPPGLQKPHHIAEIVPVILAFAVVTIATVAAWIHVITTTQL
ncbi:MAG TPA: hypothetical protein VFE18_08165 [Phenylobacterium sp.]|jgi:hypothetical protein|nr:hypothetical protein [Phenylobacterium sp.]HZZ68135.1 hypothetical protein [Phenylobacterium sp.]